MNTIIENVLNNIPLRRLLYVMSVFKVFTNVINAIKMKYIT